MTSSELRFATYLLPVSHMLRQCNLLTKTNFLFLLDLSDR